ncbi:hypothetical protein [Pseudomonas putida]|uniref:hypothetical protein n=1 Tax=Pseudomonas putida TaxID=303 RepID=UPI003D9607B4
MSANVAILSRKTKRSVELRSKPQEKTAWGRLPFVGKDHGPRHSDWDVPLTGGYFGGIEAGKIVARMYLKYLRDERDNPIRLGTTHLQGMLLALNAKVPTTKSEEESLRGQRVGFIHELGTWLEAAVSRLGSSFDAIPERSFVQQANASLASSDAAFMAAISGSERQAGGGQ